LQRVAILTFQRDGAVVSFPTINFEQEEHHDDENWVVAKRSGPAGLINILGVDKAIYACRSNYWHGVLRFVLTDKRSLDRQPRPCGFMRPDRNVSRDGLSQTVTNRRQKPHLLTSRRYVALLSSSLREAARQLASSGGR
jgi:hypothetical protein